MTTGVHLFGIRHHGPGSARSVLKALDELVPDCLLVEGPPEADSLLPLILHDSMKPPVALLVYEHSNPALASFCPFTAFSPEWNAIRYGLQAGIPVKMMDLEQAVQLSMAEELSSSQIQAQAAAHHDDPRQKVLQDPLQLLAEAAGYSESELWWEHLVEQRRDTSGVFPAIHEAITALRAALPLVTDPLEVRREAAMRQSLRLALARGYQRVAVVCGAWHLPALENLDDEERDLALLSGLRKLRVRATWIPWSITRLTRTSGYSAGIRSPGWYRHLWENQDSITEGWLALSAQLLRAEGFDVPPGSVIDAVRLADGLAALRSRPMPGLPELAEACLSVFCFSNPLPMQLIEQKLIVGDDLGSVPPETPMAPLQIDLERLTKKLRMKLEARETLLNLDLRDEKTHLERSHLLHRLNLLGIPWGHNIDAEMQPASSHSGTFHERWRMQWEPEYAIRLLNAGMWGNTIAAAASTCACEQADQTQQLTALTGMVKDLLLADLPDAVTYVMACLQARVAASRDVLHLMEILLPLADVLRYGSVRRIQQETLQPVVDELLARICLALVEASSKINQETAQALLEKITAVDDAIKRLSEPAMLERWQTALRGLLDASGVHPLLAGRTCRMLLEAELLPPETVQRRLGLELSPAVAPEQSAAWIDGFLRGSGQILLHDATLLALLDRWIDELPAGSFQAMLPALRRIFATFTRPERERLGEKIRGGSSEGGTAEFTDPNFDTTQADLVLPLVTKLLGRNHDQARTPPSTNK